MPAYIVHATYAGAHRFQDVSKPASHLIILPSLTITRAVQASSDWDPAIPHIQIPLRLYVTPNHFEPLLSSTHTHYCHIPSQCATDRSSISASSAASVAVLGVCSTSASGSAFEPLLKVLGPSGLLSSALIVTGVPGPGLSAPLGVPAKLPGVSVKLPGV
jgi:hypothetical protein